MVWVGLPVSSRCPGASNPARSTPSGTTSGLTARVLCRCRPRATAPVWFEPITPSPCVLPSRVKFRLVASCTHSTVRNQLASWVDDRFFLVVSETAPMRVLREMEHHVERPAVTQAAKDREPELEETPADLDLINFEERVRASLGKPQATLAAVVAEVLPKMAKERRYASIGQIAAYVAANAQPPTDA